MGEFARFETLVTKNSTNITFLSHFYKAAIFTENRLTSNCSFPSVRNYSMYTHCENFLAQQSSFYARFKCTGLLRHHSNQHTVNPHYDKITLFKFSITSTVINN